jgi:hypothetical protein
MGAATALVIFQNRAVITQSIAVLPDGRVHVSFDNYDGTGIYIRSTETNGAWEHLQRLD